MDSNKIDELIRIFEDLSPDNSEYLFNLAKATLKGEQAIKKIFDKYLLDNPNAGPQELRRSS